MRRAVAALPLRVRLVAGFVLAMTVVLTGAGAFVYWRVSYALDLRLDQDLRAEAAALAPLVTDAGALRPDPGLERTPGAQQYQVLDDAGRVLAHGSAFGPAALLSAEQARRATRSEVVADRGELLPASRRPLRLLTLALPGPGPARVLLVGDRRDGRDEALRELLAQLLLAGVGALALAALVGERLARAALAPVERYRARAASIAAGAQGVRLEVPAGRDDEVTRLGHTLNDVLDALEQALERERRFTQDASHELRTPLTLLSTRVQLALRRERSPQEHEQVLRELARDVDGLRALAEQLLRTTTAARRAPGPGCDLAAVVRASVAGAVAPGEVPVLLPAEQVRQVADNLVGNATAHGAGPVRVEVRSEGGVAVLTVTDEGPGVEPAFLPQAADRFARADTARGRPGAGLGLSLVRALVEAHDGELRLCSRGVHHRYAQRYDVACGHPPGGTTATVLLPCTPPAI